VVIVVFISAIVVVVEILFVGLSEFVVEVAFMNDDVVEVD